jgi:ABC-2 type transport system ATP-binding protein
MSEVRGIVKSLKSKKRLIFMSSHILSEVSEVCDEVAMIDHGKLVVYDTIPNVTAKFTGGENIVEVELKRPIDSELTIKKIAAIASIVTAERKNDRSLTIRFSGGSDAQEKILSDLVKMNIGVISYRPASSELEDAYLKLITSTV